MVRTLDLKTQQVRTIPVGAAAWPRCRMHGAQTLRDEAVAPTRNPSRRGRRSYQAGAFLTVIPTQRLKPAF
jgi:hypothetical protein